MKRPENYERGCVEAVQGSLADDKLALASIAISLKRVVDLLRRIADQDAERERD